MNFNNLVIMELNEEQKKVLASWLSEGLGLSEIQRKLKEELGVNITFMELRFLIDDLNLELKDEEPPPPPAQKNPADGTLTQSDAEEDFDDFQEEAHTGTSGGSVKVTVDTVQRPGAVISGTVVFSDGHSASWQIDQFGRLGLIPDKEGYTPSQEDITEFQIALRSELQKQRM